MEKPLVVKLPRQPGRKECRYAHLLSGQAALVGATENVADSEPPGSAVDPFQFEALQQQVASIKKELVELKKEFSKFKSQFE